MPKLEEEVQNPDFSAWIRADQVIPSWILGSLYRDILSVVVGIDSAKEVWLALAKYFNHVTSSRLFELQRKLHIVSKNNKNMEEYLREVKSTCDQLTSIGNPVSEKMIFLLL